MPLYKVAWELEGCCESLVEAPNFDEAKRRASPGDIDQAEIDEQEWSIVDVVEIEE